MIRRLVAANLTHRPVRSVLSILLIAVPVALMLILVGLSRGFVEDSTRRMRGVGADIIVRSSDFAVGGSMALTNIPYSMVRRLEQIPHVRMTTGVASNLVSG